MGKKIYIVSPYGLVTGGTDALHQLCFYISKLGFDANIVYCDVNSKNKDIPIAFRQYINSYLLTNEVIDDENNILIVPETICFYLNCFKNIKKFIWWLSVDNNLYQSKNDKSKFVLNKLFSKRFWKRLFSGYYSLSKIKYFNNNKPYDFEQENPSIHHICASYYAYYFVKERSKNKVDLLLDPISDYFLKKGPCFKSSGRQNVVLYNPKKNFQFSKKIIDRAKDIKFLALENFNYEQLVNLYRNSKIYMDFGNFPGSDRIPREACYNGMLIITGKNGASGIYEDVPIPDDYKFDSKDENIDLIIQKIRDCMANYDSEYPLFDHYRLVVSSLKDNYCKSIVELFDK